jgi:hypothetical protein
MVRTACSQGEIMPHYRFNLHLEDQVLRDREGQYFSGPDTLWDVTESLARELIQTSIVQPSNWLKCHLEVVDDTGEVVIDFPFVAAVERQVA